MKNTIIGLIIGFSLAGNVYAWQLHTGHVASIKQACVERTDDLASALQRGIR